MVDIITQMNTRIRLVRCPRCRKVLAEPDIPVYKCGGCETVLQAKNRKNDTKEAELSSHDTNSSRNYEDECVSDGSNQESTLPVLQSSPRSDYKGDEYGIQNRNEQLQDTNFSDELPSSRELSGDGTEKLSIETIDSMEETGNKCPPGEDARKDGNKANNELPGNRTSSDELLNSTKNRKNDTNEAELSSHKAISSRNHEDECVSDGSNQESTLHVLESSPGSDIKGDEYGTENQNEQPGDTHCLDELPSLSKLSGDGTGKLSIEVIDSMEEGESKSPLGQYARKDGSETLNHDNELPKNRTSSDELLDSGEFSYCETEDSSLEISEAMKQDENRTSLKYKIGKYAKEYEDGCSEKTGDMKCSDELHSADDPNYHKLETSPPRTSECIKLNGRKDMFEANQSELYPGVGEHIKGEESIYLPENDNGKCQCRYAGKIEESSQNIELANEASSSGMVASNKVETSSIIVNDHEDNANHSKSSDIEGSLSPNGEDVTIAAQSPLNEGILSRDLSPDDIYLQKSQKKVERVSSAETFESLPVMTRYPRHAMSKSPTRIYYAGDASDSSYDGIDDQVLDQPLHLYKRKSKTTDPSSTHRSRRKDGSRVNKMENSGLEMHHEGTSLSSMFAENNNYAISGKKWSQGELPEPRRDAHPTRRTMRLDNNNPLSKRPYISRSSQLAHGNGSPSSYRNNEFHSPGTTSFTEPDKMELLRMVYELENKLNQTQISTQMENARIYSGDQRDEKHNPTGYDDRYTRGIGWSGQSKISRIAFSGEAAGYSRHQVEHLCSHCHHHEWKCSRHSPSHSTSCSKCQSMVHLSDNLYKAFPSRSSTPKHYTSSEFSTWGHERKHTEHEVKRLYLEKYHAAKRHLRPLAGGAPIIVCSHCSELLQLPIDFFVFKKRLHQLRCHSCNSIQKFALQRNVHLVPYVPNASTPPPSEVDDNGEAATSRTLAPTSHSIRSPRAEPVSCSEAYDPSFSRSCSIERAPPMVALGSHFVLQRNSNNGKMSSGHSFQPSMEDRKMNSVSTKSRIVYREASESVGSSSNKLKFGNSTSEIQEVDAASGFPLHRLMGYSSPSHVLFASASDESEVEMRFR